MKKRLLIIIGVSIFTFVSIQQIHADPSTYLNLPPTNAFDKIHTDNGTVSAVNFSMPLTVKGGSGISVQSSNASHTLTITNTATPNTHNGSYNTTQANNVNINTGGYKINFINGTGATVHLQNSGAGNQVNVTVSASGTGGITSVNSQTGPAVNITCVSGNTTCTNSTNQIKINTGSDIPHLSQFNNFTKRMMIQTFAGSYTPLTTCILCLQGDGTSIMSIDTFGSLNQITGRRADGTVSSPTKTLSGEPLFELNARGYEQVTPGFTGNVGFLKWVADESFTNTAQGSLFSLFTTPIGTSTAVEHLRVTNNGNIGIGSGSKLYLDGVTATGGTFINASSTQYQLWANSVKTLSSTSTLITSLVNQALDGSITKYNNISTQGWGVPAIYGSGRLTGLTGASGTVTSYTVGASDGTFEVSSDILATTSTTYNFLVKVSWTDETGTSRTGNLLFLGSASSNTNPIVTNTAGSPYFFGIPITLHAKSGTSITIATDPAGTYTTITYNIDGIIKQVA